MLFGMLKAAPQLFWPALWVATAGNTLGGLTSYLLGRLAPEAKQTSALDRVQRIGSPALLFAWAPVIGDALCVAAGWLRLNIWKAALFMAAGKLARYLVVAKLAA
jgi:membrane protein YqaA with SNARE-associated domain